MDIPVMMVCRLCMSNKNLINLYADDNAIALKINTCLDLQVFNNDGLSSFICKLCEEKITQFYDFKQKCLLTDFELRFIMYKYTVQSDQNKNLRTNKDESGEFDIYTDTVNFMNNIEFVESDSNILEHKQNLCENTSKEESKELEQNIQDGVQCEICGIILKKKIFLKRHLQSHYKTKLYTCKICSKSFSRLANKDDHMLSHYGIKSYICEMCARPFTKRPDLLRHIKIHSTDKNYSCPNCNRRFKRANDVNVHMRIHTGERRYKCKFCSKKYTSHSGMRNHIKSLHSNKT